jgi:hypothetical protein
MNVVGTPMYGSKFFAPTAAAIERGDRMMTPRSLMILLALTDSTYNSLDSG